MKETLAEILRRLNQLARSKWTGQIKIEINMFQGGIGSAYFAPKEKIGPNKIEKN